MNSIAGQIASGSTVSGTAPRATKAYKLEMLMYCKWGRMATASVRITVYVIAVAFVLAYGITGTYVLGKAGDFNGFNPKSNGIITAAYFTITTISTVGYGDITPSTQIAKIFIITLILGGLGVFFSAAVTISGEFLTGRIETLSGRIGRAESKLFGDHVVLIGTNTTNLYLAERLKENKERFIIITSDKVKADKLRYNNNYMSYVADATSDTDMQRFQLDKARSIVIDVKDSSRTIYVLLVAKELAKDKSIIVIAPSEEAERHIRSLHVTSSIVNPSFIAASEISKNLFKK